MDEALRKEAEKEFQALLELRVDKEMKRTEELKKKGLICGLDGYDYWKDIKDWFYTELEKLRKKYGITGKEN